MDAVDTLGRAIGILERETATTNPAAFAQIDTGNMQKMLSGFSTVIDAAAFSASDRTKLMALVQSSTEDEEDDAGAPAPDAYKSHSGGIVDILDDRKEKAASELSEFRKVESNAQHTFNMLKQSLEGQIAADYQGHGGRQIRQGGSSGAEER